MDPRAQRPGGARAAGPAAVTPLGLLERLRANDAAAWRQVVGTYGPLIRLWCWRAGLGAEDAQDVLQDVLAAAAAGFAGFHWDGPGDTFPGWLRGITQHQIQRLFRRRQGQPRAEGGAQAWQRLQEVADPRAAPDDEEQAAVGEVYRRALEQVRGQFEPPTWQAFWRTAVEGRAPADLVDELGMSAAAIRQAKSRVLRRLRGAVGARLD
jgi:RNA polymerase sigma-70 factor (ECF subfamily)